MKLYTIVDGVIEIHHIVRETPKGWTVLANWSRDPQKTCHIKRRDIISSLKPLFRERYTTTSLNEAISLTIQFQTSIEEMMLSSKASVNVCKGLAV